MKNHTTFRLGGSPEKMVVFQSSADYIDAVKDLGDHRVIGGGSNLLVSETGPSGKVAILSRPGSGVLDVDGNKVLLDAAGNWHESAKDLSGQNLASAESMVGIPGTVGGAVVQNIGAYGTEIRELIDKVLVFDTNRNEKVWLENGECGFAYRDSRFKSQDRGRFVVLQAVINVTPGAAHKPKYAELAKHLSAKYQTGTASSTGEFALSEVSETVLELRSKKNMVWSESDSQTWGAGSFFVNPQVNVEEAAIVKQRLNEDEPPSWSLPDARMVKFSAGWLVERAGFKRGHKWQKVGLAPGHALGMVNISGEATASDVVAAANEVAAAVCDISGITLLAEPILFGFNKNDVKLEFEAHIEP